MYHTIGADSPLDKTLYELGVPLWDILAGRSGDEQRFYEFAGDRRAGAGATGRISERRRMSRIDVRDLTSEKLPVGSFPADSRADFRLHIAPEVRRGIEQHAKADVTVEICGVLVGNWGIDDNGPYATVTDYIRCENAASKFAEVTFTHESWAQINKEMDSKFADARIVGWYHSHPDFGIFLSERDCFIHEHFFSGPGQVAYVIDPVRDLEGVFAWRDGKPTAAAALLDRQQRSHGGSQPAQCRGARWRRSPAASSVESAAIRAAQVVGRLDTGFRDDRIGLAERICARLSLRRLAIALGSNRMIIEGAVAHFADTKMIRDGLEDELGGRPLASERICADELDKLPEPAAKLSKKELEEAATRRVTDQR